MSSFSNHVRSVTLVEPEEDEVEYVARAEEAVDAEVLDGGRAVGGLHGLGEAGGLELVPVLYGAGGAVL